MQLIDKNQIVDYLIAIKPNEAFSDYGVGVIDIISHVLHYISDMPTTETEKLIDKSTAIQRLCAACSNMGSFACGSCVIPGIIKGIPAIKEVTNNG